MAIKHLLYFTPEVLSWSEVGPAATKSQLKAPQLTSERFRS